MEGESGEQVGGEWFPWNFLVICVTPDITKKLEWWGYEAEKEVG